MYEPPILYEIVTDCDPDGRTIVQFKHDSNGIVTVASKVKETIRKLREKRAAYDVRLFTLSGLVYRYMSDQPDEEPVLLFRFSDSGTYCDLIPIEGFEMETWDNNR